MCVRPTVNFQSVPMTNAASRYSVPISIPKKKQAKMFRYLFIALLCVFCTQSLADTVEKDSSDQHGRCEPITTEFCKHLSYNETLMPNSMNHQTQDEAGRQARDYQAILNMKCNPELRFLLCSVYVPSCKAPNKIIPPCRSFCERAKKGCELSMRHFSLAYPDSLDCSKMPVYGQEPCIIHS